MFFRVLKAEWMKARRGLILGLAVTGPLLAARMGADGPGAHPDLSPWMGAYIFSMSSYASMYLPVIAGVIAAVLCRSEHTGGGWKQLLSLPVSRSHVYLAKYLLLILAVLTMQALFVVLVAANGLLEGYPGEIPWDMYLSATVSGWVAMLPLTALQLWTAYLWRNFGASLAVNAVLTVPSVLVANSEKFGPWYPWSQPFLAMFPAERNWFFVSPETLFAVILGGFLLFFGGGWIQFSRRDW
jgi:hypothetical protein